MRYQTLLVSALVVAWPLSTVAQEAPRDSLRSRLLRARHVIRLERDGTPAGDGADLLLRAGRESRFFLIGEEHGVAQVPALTGALYRALYPVGYRHLALEIGPDWADTLNVLAARPDPEVALLDFYNRYPPGPLFYTLREEAAMLAEVMAASGDAPGTLWGLDYDIVGDRYPLRRLRSMAPSPTARDALERTIAYADSAFAAALADANPTGILMFAGPESVLVALRNAFQPEPGSKADRVLHQLQETVAINRLFLNGLNYESNRRRAALARANFLASWNAARGESGTTPRVMLKFGANHMSRGRTPTDVFDLGNLASELGAANGSRSFHLMAVAGPGARTAAFDPRTFGWTTGPAEIGDSEWAAPLVDLVDRDAWTLYDLRALREPLHDGKFGRVNPELERIIYAFDAIVILGGSTPSTGLSIGTAGPEKGDG